jgi:hypothetical protein
MTHECGEAFQRLQELHRIFNSRTYWGSGDVESEDSCGLGMLRILDGFRSEGELCLEFHTIELAKCPRPSWGPGDDYEWRMATFACERRGKQDLKDYMWSGYRYLQKSHSNEQLETTGRSLPFLYIASSAGRAVTAGNVGVATLLRSIVNNELASVSVVAAAGTWLNTDLHDLRQSDFKEFLRRCDALQGLCDMATVTFSATVRDTLDAFFEQEDARSREALLSVQTKMESRIFGRGRSRDEP